MPFLTQGRTNWKYIIIFLIVVIIIGAGILGWIKKQEVPLSELPEIEKIEEETEKFTLDELKNSEYYVSVFEETVQLEDGYYFRPWLPDSATGLRVEILDEKIAFGDLNNDGKEDAAVIVYSSGGGSGGFRDLAVVINESGKPSGLTSKFLGDRVMINSITIQSGVITLDMVVHGPEDGLCCPSVEKIFKYELSENQLMELTIQYPHKGEVFLAGETCTICSESIKKDVLMNIALYMSNGDSGLIKILEKKNIIPKWSGLYYDFEFLENLQTGDTYQIYISSEGTEGYSESFTIVGEDDWKTYRNEEYGYEFKYPLSINKENSALASFFNIEVATSDPGYEVCEFFHPGIGGTVKGKKLKINNADFCAMAGTGGAAGTVDVNYIYITEKDGKYFTIQLYDSFASRGTCECYCRGFDLIDNLFNQILSTFRFSE